ncbi:MAG: nickel-dependent hydrogenase large subunit [Propionibacteriaceae bacterium]|jgi:hydrogenase large subunit|nr:nickel-dependent hydrogenase large subunit [Propionibacteriaceae bacterium]
MAKIVVDPITRIEGHLRIELESEGGVILKDKAWSETTQFRGLETILQGRDPRDAWAFVGRICGVCTSVHAIASITAVENAIGSNVPTQAKNIRQIMLEAQEIQDHVIHFYHLHALDFVDPASAIEADPQAAVDFAKTIGSTWKGNTLERMTAVKDTVKALVESGQLSIFSGGYIGHPAYKLPPEANLMAVAHYLDALEFQRSMIRIVTTFGGKNPHPNFLVGGMACTIDPEHSESINQVQLDQVSKWIDETLEFVEGCYLPDALAIVGVYKEYFDIGASSPNFIATGLSGTAIGGNPKDAAIGENNFKPGVVYDMNLGGVEDFDADLVEEWATSAWYTYAGGDVGVKPLAGETVPTPAIVPRPPYAMSEEDAASGKKFLNESEQDKYTWCKAPRYNGKPVQVGPLARLIVGYARGHAEIKEIVDYALSTLGITAAQLNSTAGRALARCAESVISARELKNYTFPKFVAALQGGDIDVFDASKWDPETWAAQCSGYAFVEVARGNLSHWVNIENGKITNYQCVVPTTWLAGGRDAQGQIGPYEHSLAGDGKHPLVDPTKPVEVLRTIHSFDPCMSCAVHVLDADGVEVQAVVS